MRHQVDQLLLALWEDPVCKESLAAVAQAANAGSGGTAGGHLVEYARAVLNNLMYLLKVCHRARLCQGIKVSCISHWVHFSCTG